MIDHIGFAVSDFGKSKAFYTEALRSLGIALLVEVTAEQTGGAAHAGFGSGDKAYFWIGDGGGSVGPVHTAFTADTRAQVDAFYQAALRTGGRDNGAPGIRAHYHPNYYGAFVLDPDGNNIEAVCHHGA
jgi:catechol 2,3-dioxygenase-like lactoylglutathione lyase family enzyme